MTKVKMQKRRINSISKKSYIKNLSIQFSLDGFSFCISNLHTKEIHHFGSFLFEETVATPELLLTKIETIVNDTTLLNQSFEAVTIIHQNNLSTLVPTSLFDEKNMQAYLEYNIKTFSSDFITFDSILQANAKNVYVPYMNINNFFFQKFGEFEYKHHTTILLEKLLLHSKNNTQKQLFVHVSKNQLDIIVIENSKLLLLNTFHFNTKNDFIYYILFIAEQLQLNPEEIALTFLGEISYELICIRSRLLIIMRFLTCFPFT